MATTNNNLRESWDSLSSAFASLEISFSPDSCYGSDEVSVSSNTTTPLQSSVSTLLGKREHPLHPFLKPILKNSSAGVSDNIGSESGYGTDDIEIEYDALSDDEGEADDMSDFSVWEETSQDVPETREDHTESFDDSFIGFETMVRFDPRVHYIESPKFSDDDECPENQMTFHEMMLLAQKSPGSQDMTHQYHEDDACDDETENHKEFVRINTNQPGDFTRDAVEVDRQLFVAYMNGMHGIADTKYKSYLRAQVDNIRQGQEAESMHPDDAPCMYLDLITNHVIGIFRNLLAVEELDALIQYRNEDSTTYTAHAGLSNPALNHHQALLDKIEHLLLDRLTNGRVDICPDELSFFAGGIAHALGTKDLPASA